MDEAIAIHRCIVEAQHSLATTHPVREAKQMIKAQLREDATLLRELERLGAEVGATGKVEEVAGSMTELMTTGHPTDCRRALDLGRESGRPSRRMALDHDRASLGAW